MDAHDLLRSIPDAVDAESLEGLDVTVQYEIERPLVHVVRNGQVEVKDGAVEDADVVISASDDLLLDLYRGKANAAVAFMMGKLRIRGDVGVAKRLVDAVDRERLPDAD